MKFARPIESEDVAEDVRVPIEEVLARVLVVEEFLPAGVKAFKGGSPAQEVVLGYDRVSLRVERLLHLVHCAVAVCRLS